MLVGFAACPLQLSSSWFRAPSGPLIIFLFSRILRVFKWSLLFDEMRGLTSTGHSLLLEVTRAGTYSIIRRGNMFNLPLPSNGRICSLTIQAFSRHITIVKSPVFRVRVRAALRLAVCRQSVHLGTKPLQTTSFFFVSVEPLWSQSLCNILSDGNIVLSLVNMLRLCQVYVSHI